MIEFFNCNWKLAMNDSMNDFFFHNVDVIDWLSIPLEIFSDIYIFVGDIVMVAL